MAARRTARRRWRSQSRRPPRRRGAPAAAPAAAPAPAASGGGGGGAAADLNEQFVAWLRAEWQKADKGADWTEAVKEYVRYRDALGDGATTAPASLPVLSFGAGSAPAPPVPLFGAGTAPLWRRDGAGAGARARTRAGARARTRAGARVGGGGGRRGGGGGRRGVDTLWAGELKLSVYRTEKKSDDGELIQEKGWKPVGKGQLRLLRQDGVAFVEFRPLVSVGGSESGDASEDMSGAKTRFGRAVLSARLLASTTFALNKKSIQTTLIANDAGGTATIARSNIPLASEALAAELLGHLEKAKPAA